MSVNHDRLQEFPGKAVGHIGAAMSANMVLLGDRLGLYKARAKMGAVTRAELAKATKTAERYIREWPGNQAAGGYVTYDAETGLTRLPRRAGDGGGRRKQPLFPAWCLPSDRGHVYRQSQYRATVQDRERSRMGST